MNSQRSQMIFIGVIVLAIMIVAIGLLTRGGQNQPVSAPPQPQPAAATPLPAGSVQVNIESSNTKEDWMNAMVGKFNASGAKTKSGKPIVVTVKHGGSVRHWTTSSRVNRDRSSTAPARMCGSIRSIKSGLTSMATA